MEIGYDQAAALRQLLEGCRWVREVEVLKDLGGKDRVVIAYGVEYT